MVEIPRFCENCGRYTAHKKQVFGQDGLCRLILKKPQPVSKGHFCKYWIERKTEQ